MKDISEFVAGEEVRLKKNLSKEYWGDIDCLYSGKLIHIENSSMGKDVLTLFEKDTYGSMQVKNFIPMQDIENDPIVRVTFDKYDVDGYYKCYFPVKIGTEVIVSLYGKEEKAIVSGFKGDASRAVRYVLKYKNAKGECEEAETYEPIEVYLKQYSGNLYYYDRRNVFLLNIPKVFGPPEKLQIENVFYEEGNKIYSLQLYKQLDS